MTFQNISIAITCAKNPIKKIPHFNFFLYFLYFTIQWEMSEVSLTSVLSNGTMSFTHPYEITTGTIKRNHQSAPSITSEKNFGRIFCTSDNYPNFLKGHCNFFFVFCIFDSRLSASSLLKTRSSKMEAIKIAIKKLKEKMS